MSKYDLKKTAMEIKRKVVSMHSKTGCSHLGCSLSIADIITVLYFDILKVFPKNPKKKGRDRFILSKGHACSSLYAALAMRGFFPGSWLDKFYVESGRLAGHPSVGSPPGIETSTGSLGHGLSVGLGMALSMKADGEGGKVFVLLGDGECNEGSVWEAALFAAHNRLDNVVVIIDRNMIQGYGSSDDIIRLEPLMKKWESFGWAAREADGHSIRDLRGVLRKLPLRTGKPSVIIARTTHGKGVSYMEGELAWHYRTPVGDQCAAALQELET